MGKQQYVPAKKNNIVPIKMDASFYYERAMKSLNKLNYQKALRYFRKTLECEPNNPVHYCNTACLLADLGKFEESNRIIWHVLERIDSDLPECYFYLASNYANLMDFELAEQYALKYCETAPMGEYIEDAEDILDYVAENLQFPPREGGHENRELSLSHEKARRLLEEGRFAEASRLLQKLAGENPDFIAARNNLALCYYYMGRFEKAMETVRQVLESEPFNIHGLCNLAVFYSHIQNQSKLDELLAMLKKIVPYHYDQTYKLATTLGILGENDAAYFLFRLMIAHTGYSDPYIMHYCAAAAYNTKRFGIAERLWEKINRLDPGQPVASYYLQHIQAKKVGKPAIEEASYHYEIPDMEKLLCTESLKGEGLSEEMKKNPLIRSSFLWALRFGDKDTKLQVIQSFEHIADKEVEEALRLFLMNPAEDDYLKKVAVFALRKMGAKEPIDAIINNTKQTIDPNDMPEKPPVWLDKWQRVMDCVYTRMDERYDIFQQQQARNLWMQYIDAVYPDVPVIRKEEAWAAAIEYLVARQNRAAVTQAELAKRYGVSTASLARNCKLISQACSLQE
ncbi:tetratricopeptide repeat protein [Aneurinibacillus sp. Ricciae_BoGa-3]|uniref:tetratricopeptide repeat protein n=1 Tax=Aneurinibacillus sp. Ricciae_BoGa-3 TaxID=3022697 RepID=UPI00234175B3|nr:tetratricopeptide repeat protein [Aneurinibacillus sp. Ricciae_BoGa-3]WCK54132.1 tetratricopeptide repeat protein [Aneurinibacillus sp. Ricciae_BoGa-3]